MNYTIMNEMFESEEFGEMRFNYNVRDMLLSDEFDEESGNNIKSMPQEEQKKSVNLVDELLFSDEFEFDEIFEELEREIKSIPQEEQKKNVNLVDELLFSDEFEFDEIFEELEKEINSTIYQEEHKYLVDKYDGYNKLDYQGQEYYVKKTNFQFPICVMNTNLVQVGIISKDNINNIKML